MLLDEKIKHFKDWQFKCSAYSMGLSVLEIDKMTIAPIGGDQYRNERIAFLSGELYSLKTDPEIISILKELKDNNSVDYSIKRQCELYHDEIMKDIVVPKDEFVSFQKLLNDSYSAWLNAKEKNDYSLFEPYLNKVIEEEKKIYSYRNSNDCIYNQMLNDYEPDMNIEKYDNFFSSLKDRIVPLVQKIKKSKQINDDFIYKKYDIENQKKFMNYLLEYLHFDSNWGYQNETEHPFTAWICENDVRITTKYLENNIISAIFSTIHESGHARYEHQCSSICDGNILSEGISSGMHESQSRLCENYLGRTKSFWINLYPKLQELFKDNLQNISLDDFIKAINVSKPSLVRTEADELTYPLHIYIRYEIEKGLFDGTYSTKNLNEVWNKMYKDILGVEVTNDRDGILQDVHWSNGSFGYFPTYALGSAYSAQFMYKMRKDIDVDKLLEKNQFETIMNWLKENIHQYGCLYKPEVIINKATNQNFDINYYLDYLENKYSKLYDLI